MADLIAARRYAQAAFELAAESGTVDRWRADLNDVAAVLAESDMAPVLTDSRIPEERRLAMLDRVLDVQPLALNLAKLLVSKGRAADARAVEQAFSQMADERQGIVHAEVVTAIDLPADQLASIERRIATALGKQVKSTARVDPRILGGVVIRIGDRLIDGSVRTRLRELRRELEGAR